MSSFTTAAVFRSTDDYQGSLRVYEVEAGYRYYLGAEGSLLFIDVATGMKTDLASIPRALRGVFPPDGRWAPAAILHDRLYRECLVSRAISDRVLYEAMGVIHDKRIRDGKPGIPWWQRIAIYYGVRLGGWVPYNAYAKAKLATADPSPEGEH